MTADSVREGITLYFREGSSDKIYQAWIHVKGEGFIVSFAYGRRGASLTAGTKTKEPVDYDKAKKIFDKLVAEKIAKGYSPGEEGTAYVGTDKEKLVSGVQCQLLNFITEEEALRLCDDPRWGMQIKYNGERRMLRKLANGEIDGINKLGLRVPLPKPVHTDLAAANTSCLLDGEGMGDYVMAFDMLEIDGKNIRNDDYQRRYTYLKDLLGGFNHPSIKLVDIYISSAEKRIAFNKAKDCNEEGVVFKNLSAPFNPGRPNSGGTQLKYQFRAQASFVVAKVNAKRSVGITLVSAAGMKPIECGNVSVPVSFSIPGVGDVVEVKYLYAFKESNCLHQPVYLGPRIDVLVEECTIDQLKYKKEDEE